MSLTASLQELEFIQDSIYVMHERCENNGPVHAHSKGQLSYIEGGLGYIRLREKLFVIPARHYIWIPAGVEHTITFSSTATICHSLFFHTNEDSKDGFYAKVGIYPVNELLYQMIRFTDEWDAQILPGAEGFVFLQSIKDILPKVSNRLLSVALPFTENKKMLKILAYMDDNLSETHTLASISQRFGLSERTLSRFFQSVLKVSFLQYLKRLRMARAFELIAANEHSLTEVAYLCGYQSLSSFSNAFNRVTKTRPSQRALLNLR